MNIMVLGGSSTIGISIIKSLAKGNRLFLLSTHTDNLEELKSEVLLSGAKQVELIDCDLGVPIEIEKIINNNIDMLINIACSLSTVINNDVMPSNHAFHTYVDLTNPLIILEDLLKKLANRNDNSVLHLIFINTILTKINSPGKSIYYSYKILQEEYINGFRRKYGDRLKTINVIVGRQIDRTKESLDSINLANRIKLAIEKNESEFIYGLEGKIIYYLHSISPIISNSLIYLKRLIKNITR